MLFRSTWRVAGQGICKFFFIIDEMDAMMYKIEGEDLYLIGTSEHSMIGKFIDTINDEEKLPYTLTSYSPCFRKEKGAHGIEERGVYRIHQFEKQEMIVVCKPEQHSRVSTGISKLRNKSTVFFQSLSYHSLDSSGLHTTIISCFSNWWIRYTPRSSIPCLLFLYGNMESSWSGYMEVFLHH